MVPGSTGTVWAPGPMASRLRNVTSSCWTLCGWATLSPQYLDAPPQDVPITRTGVPSCCVHVGFLEARCSTTEVTRAALTTALGTGTVSLVATACYEAQRTLALFKAEEMVGAR